MSNELDLGKAIASGEVESPQQYENVWLYALRITGTGVAYRGKIDQFVYRDPDNYLTEEFLERCAGLPVIWEHPETDLLTSEEFGKRVIGTIMFAYIVGEEVWGIAKVYDDDAISAMKSKQMSTSPCIAFVEEGEVSHLGEPLLIEGRPVVVDHLAICEEGVWDRGGDPTGVNQQPTEETIAMDEQTTNVEPSLSDIAKLIAGLGERIERLEGAEKQEIESMDDSSPVIGDPEMGEEKITAVDAEHDLDQNKVSASDDDCSFAKDDDDDDEDEPKKDDDDDKKVVAADAMNKELMDRIARLEAQLKGNSDEERNELSAIQKKADSVYAAFSDAAPAPLAGEQPLAYRRRVLEKLKKYSDDYKSVDLSVVKDSAMLAIVEKKVYADAMAASKSSSFIGAGNLTKRVREDGTGRRITEYHGDPSVWMNDFKWPKSNVLGFNKGGSH